MQNDPKKGNQRRSQWGKSRAESPLRVVIVECTCGNKYVKTRKDQERCLTCMYRSRAVKP